MITSDKRWRPDAHRAEKPCRNPQRRLGGHIERLESRIAPAAVTALPGNSNFEETADFTHWTVSSGPGSTFVEYLPENVSTTVIRGALAPEGDAYAHLSFLGQVAPGGTGYGPSLRSETFAANAGEDISVVWRATNDGDVAHPRGRLFTAAGTPVGTFFDADTGTTAFATSSVSVASSGEYYLLFEIGSSDLSVGGSVGAKLDIDAIHRSPNGVAVSALPSGQFVIEVTGENVGSDAPNDFVITRDTTGQYLEVFVNGNLDFIGTLSSVDRINVTGLGGADRLTVDSSNGLIGLADGIYFDGGAASDTLTLTQAVGGATLSTETFEVGPAKGQGASQISDGSLVQTVHFQNVEPVLNNVPVTSLTVNATAADNAISAIVGSGGGVFTGATGKITIDDLVSLEFNNKTSLTLNALAGNDSVLVNLPVTPSALASITIQGGDSTFPVGDTLALLSDGAIHPSSAGTGTITATGLPSLGFTGMETVVVGGVSTTPGVNGLDVSVTGDRFFAGQDDAFVLSTSAAVDYLTLSLNGSIGLYAHRDVLAHITVSGLGGNDSLTLNGTAAAETLTFAPQAVDMGTASVSGLKAVDYSTIESVVLNGMGGDDTFAVGGSVGAVKLIGGTGSDRVDFSAAASRIVFDLDAVGVDQYVNTTGQIVTLGDVIENFTGSSYNDTLRVRAANFPRDLQGGDPSHETPPGDELFFDGLQKVVNTDLASFTTGTYTTVGYGTVTFGSFDTPTIVNSPSGPGFGAPGDNSAFNSAHVYDLLKSTSGGKKLPGKAPTATATGDLNGDGFADIVIVNSATSNISVLLNLGDGTFANPIAYKTRGVDPHDIVIGNFDANPGLDLAVTNRGSNTLAIFSGDNHGGFSTATLTKTAAAPSSVVVGELNGDGIDDLVIVYSLSTRVSVLLGNGNGFNAATLFKSGGLRPVDAVIGDFNADGHADIVTVNRFSNNVSFLQGDGLGGLAPATKYSVGLNPTSIAIADFNLDGVPDVAVSNQVSRYVSVLFSNGAAGTLGAQFQPQLQISLASKRVPRAILAADFNGDGIADIGLLNSFGTDFTILLGEHGTTFSQPYEIGLGKFRTGEKKTDLAVVDLNNDGLLDLINLSRNSNDVRVLLRKS